MGRRKSGFRKNRQSQLRRQMTKATAEAMVRKQDRTAFEPDIMFEMKYRNADDEHADENVIEPLTEKERREQDDICENQRRLLKTALEPGGNERQMAPFTGSVVDKVMEIAAEAEKRNASAMEHSEWMHLHEELYNKHLPFSAQRYKLFRCAARGGMCQNPDIVKFLLLQRMLEKGKITKEQCDKMGGAYNAIHHMYDAMRRDVEDARRKHLDDDVAS